MFMFQVLISLTLAVAFCYGEEEPFLNVSNIKVKTTTGTIQGFYGERSTGNKKTLYWFRSIPFAEPPVGDLRFEAPVPIKPWSGVLDVTKKPEQCIQASNPAQGSEDCLYLKVYTETKPNPKAKLPVLVWIYGGGFFAGAADFDDHSPDFLLDQGVIVAALHYRVGLLGFLSTGDTVAPGNNGIRDQILALKWIKENIKNFGGDPDQITIFGQSAGAASVSYLLQIEEAKGLFSKAIINSGSSLSPWALAQNIPKVTKAIAKKLKIKTTNSSTILEGLKKADVQTLQNTASSEMTSQIIASNPLNGLVYGPVIEPNHTNAIITEKTHEKLQKGDFHHVPILAGFTSLECILDPIPAILRVWLSKYDLNPSLLTPSNMNTLAVTRLLVGNSIKLQYFGLAPVLATSTRVMRFAADTQFDKPITEAIRLYSKNTTVYAYQFAYEGDLSGRVNRTFAGVGHSEDLNYIFDLGGEGNEADYVTRNRVVKLWTNFAKSGNPTPKKESLLQNVEWPANTGSESLQFLEINTDLKVIGQPNDKRTTFWRRLYKSYARPPLATF